MTRVVTCVVLLAIAATGQAQSNALSRAEVSYLDIDFEGTRRHALVALREGEHRPAELVRIYQLLGIASSALGDEDEARQFFVQMLALDPDAELDDSVPPRLRGPYLEARGIVSARPGRLGIDVGLDRVQSAVRIELRDPADIAERVRVFARIEGSAEYASSHHPARTVIVAPLPGVAEADRVEYYVEVLDEHGNRVLEEGTEFAPRIVGRQAQTQAPLPPPPPPSRSILEEPWLWIVAGAVVLAGAATATIVIVDQRSRIGAQTQVSFGVDF